MRTCLARGKCLGSISLLGQDTSAMRVSFGHLALPLTAYKQDSSLQERDTGGSA